LPVTIAMPAHTHKAQPIAVPKAPQTFDLKTIGSLSSVMAPPFRPRIIARRDLRATSGF
jgi:hypothetical protein